MDMIKKNYGKIPMQKIECDLENNRAKNMV